MQENTWLLSFAKDVYSQTGEDGIIEKIFEIIKGDKRCVEIGAWDGKNISNTYNLMAHYGWSGVFVEADPKKFPSLQETYKGNNKAICLNRWVNFEGPDTLDNIFKDTPLKRDFDFLSIDIDGNDYHVWEAMKNYEPKVVAIEFNRNIQGDIDFVQAKDMKVNQGTSLLGMYRLAKRKGYEMVSATQANAFFVKKELFPLFNMQPIEEKDLDKFIDQNHIFKIYQLFDGTIVSVGSNNLDAFNVPLNFKKASPVPSIFKMHPPMMGPVRSFLFRAWRKAYNKLYKK